MIALGTQLAQGQPGVTTAVAIFQASVTTEVSLIHVVNSSDASANFSLFHDDDGSTFNETTTLYWEHAIAANTTFRIAAPSVGAGIMMAAGGTLGVTSSVVGALTISIYGTTARITGYEGGL